VRPVRGAGGGTVAGRAALAHFVSRNLRSYADGRSEPNSPDGTAASGLSPYLHYGHLSIQEVGEAVLGPKWTPKRLNLKTRNKDDFFCRDANVNGFLDEAITWRDVGYHWHWCRSADCGSRNAELKNVSWQELPTAGPAPHSEVRTPYFNFETMDFSPGGEDTLDLVLPEWARATLRKHARDRRERVYSLEEFEAAATHDELWNAAQKELVATGRIHNYMRMLWGKKVLEWSESPAAACRVLEHLNNKYALDGRDPNSYSGVLWCFGLFDRPWPPERKVFGTVRYMSSESAARKFDLAGYLAYANSLAR
jgi:deoxyribodipyrimidine photo-lyase